MNRVFVFLFLGVLIVNQAIAREALKISLVHNSHS
jgi:hypothetical protein